MKQILRNMSLVMVVMTLVFAGCEKGENGTGENGGGVATGTISGHEYVDLGLPSGLKWATCNVGANSPEGYGNYYAWGETTTKSSYSFSNSLTFGRDMDDISGNANYDAATANWGGTWRMPTKSEMKELANNCNWTWTTQNGVNGMRVTGPNAKSIFLPAAGYWSWESYLVVGEEGKYWGSTPFEYESDTTHACYLDFGSGFHYVTWFPRYLGLTVRPVSE